MRRPFIAGNWKMNLTRRQCVALAEGLAEKVAGDGRTDVAVCPPSVYLDAVAAALAGSPIALGAQNMHHEAGGAFTGEVSAGMLLDVGCRCVILGHSERRRYFRETDEDVNRKALAALGAGLVPIVCLGETLDQRRSGRTLDVTKRQLEGSLAGVTARQMSDLVIAYEPVWAIGTGEAATSEQAEEVHAALRQILETRYNPAVAAAVRIQYGGSVNDENAADLLARDNIDGALVGGASLKVDSFLAIIAAVPCGKA